MTSLISLFAFFALVGLVCLIVGNPLVDRSADLDTLRRLTGKDSR